MEMFQEIISTVILGLIFYFGNMFLQKFGNLKEDESKNQKWQEIINVINDIVLAVEESSKFRKMTSEEKREYAYRQVAKYANELGISVDEEFIKNLIDANVKKMRDEGKEYKKEANV
jgi:hypothetical protein